MKQINLSLAIVALAVTVGCTTTPTALDRAVSTVQTNYVPMLVLHTNVVTEVQTVTVTNSVGIPIPIFVTNTTSVVVLQTNQIPQYVLTPSPTATGVASVAGSVGNFVVPGTGGLITSGLLAALSIFLGWRNRSMAGKNTVLSQSAGVLAQIIETGREIMSKTPQGQSAADAFTRWLVAHQAETDTISAISQIVKDNVNNNEAQAAANQIIALINSPPKP